MTVTGPPASFGITTPVLAVKLKDDVVWIVQNARPLKPLLELPAPSVIVAGPTTVGRLATVPPELPLKLAVLPLIVT